MLQKLMGNDVGKLQNLMRKTARNVRYDLFDYVYTQSSGEHSSIVETTCVVIRAKGLRLPNFVCRPEHWGEIVLFGNDPDIDLPDRPIFSKRFHLTGPNRAEIIRVFNRRLTKYFESHRDVTVESVAGQVAIYRKGVTSKPNAEDMSRFIKQAKTIMRLLTA
ncbi:MAG: hypothetical protein ABGZ17_23015 [Planctomycetaceae bacterium]